MNRSEAVALCRYVKAVCPAQAIDEFTPDAWADLLHDVDFEDAKQAIQHGIRELAWRFVDVSGVLAGVKRLRSLRMREFGYILPPARFADDPHGEHQWMLWAIEEVRSGRATTPEQLDPIGRGELKQRRMPDALTLLPRKP